MAFYNSMYVCPYVHLSVCSSVHTFRHYIVAQYSLLIAAVLTVNFILAVQKLLKHELTNHIWRLTVLWNIIGQFDIPVLDNQPEIYFVPQSCKILLCCIMNILVPGLQLWSGL